MIIRSAEFVKSATHHKDCPEAPYPEYAFLGRSNVGKSSLINMLTGHRKLAKTSATPGKTQLINHFLINDAWYLCDLPGYGFAKVPLAVKKKWEQMIKQYLVHRDNLMCSFILLDARHGPMKNDMDFLAWAGARGIPICLVFTKVDKLSRSRISQHMDQYVARLSEQWNPLPPMVLSSASSGQGKEEILGFIGKWNKEYVGPWKG